MSLREVLQGLHWESVHHTVTTGTGPVMLTELLRKPDWAVLYMIRADYEWEIGIPIWMTSIERQPGCVMGREPILNLNGIAMRPWNWSAGLKEVSFSDHVPDALRRYLHRLGNALLESSQKEKERLEEIYTVIAREGSEG